MRLTVTSHEDRVGARDGVILSTWTLEKAKNQLSEVVRRAFAHEPQVVTRGRHDAVVVVARPARAGR